MIDSIIQEFEHEAETTRRHFERLPDGKFGWQPHEKSFAAGHLAIHIIECIRLGSAVFKSDELNYDPANQNLCNAETVAGLLKAFDEVVADCKRSLAVGTDEGLTQTWRMRLLGRTLVEKQRGDAFRDMCLSHLIHHRGQFSVYLRLLDVPVPSSYGPTADE